MASTSSWPLAGPPLMWRPVGRSDIRCQAVLRRLSHQLNRALVVTFPTTVRCAAAVRGATAAVISRQGMFIGAIVGSVAWVALGIMRLVSLEVVELLCAARGQRSMVAMMRIIAVVDVAIKAVRTVEPGAGSNKQPAHKPIRPVVAVGRAVIWSVVEVPVGAHRSHSNVDGNLRRSQGCAA